FALHYNKEMGADKKLSHFFFLLHYLLAGVSLVFIIAFTWLSPHSALATLKPYAFFAAYSVFFMQAINVCNFLRNWRKQGNFWIAIGLTLRDVFWRGFWFYVTLIPNLFIGVQMASTEIFKFLRTEKGDLLGKADDHQRYEDTMLYQLDRTMKEGFPLKG